MSNFLIHYLLFCKANSLLQPNFLHIFLFIFPYQMLSSLYWVMSSHSIFLFSNILWHHLHGFIALIFFKSSFLLSYFTQYVVKTELRIKFNPCNTSGANGDNDCVVVGECNDEGVTAWRLLHIAKLDLTRRAMLDSFMCVLCGTLFCSSTSRWYAFNEDKNSWWWKLMSSDDNQSLITTTKVKHKRFKM